MASTNLNSTHTVLTLLYVIPNDVNKRLKDGYYQQLRLQPEIRRFERPPDLVGTKFNIPTSDQQAIHYIKLDQQTKCGYCPNDLTEGSIGVPIKMEQSGDVTFIWMQGGYCCFEHMAEIILRDRKFALSYRNVYDSVSWQLTLYLFNKQYPGEKLILSQDYPLQVSNNKEALKHHQLRLMPSFNYYQAPHVYQVTNAKSM